MKKVKYIIALILVLASIVSLSSCYIISAQTLDKLKGTYKLTNYTYTPSYERKEGYTPRTYDYVNDEDYKYEDYLVITGEDRGYYVHKDATGEAYVKEVALSYQYSADKPSKVEYVTFTDPSNEGDDEFNRMGVNRKVLNYAKSAFNYTQLLTDKPMRTEDVSIRWEKVDNATDLSYVNEQLKDLKYYKYHAFAARGIYEISVFTTDGNGNYLPEEYQYIFAVIDPANGANTADVYFATKVTEDNPIDHQKRTVTLSFADDMSTITLDGHTFILDPDFGTNYSIKNGNTETNMQIKSSDFSEASIADMIAQRTPS